MNDSIVRFLQQQTCVTICCVDEKGSPYCFSCFYSFNAEEGLLYFKSSADTHHSVLLEKNSIISGTVLPDKLNKVITRGIQLKGEMLNHLHPLAKEAPGNYHKKYPLGMAIKGKVFTICLTDIKMTDSSFGFEKR